MGNTDKPIAEDAPGKALAEYLRAWRQHADLTYRDMGEAGHFAHTTLSQNVDGRLTVKWAPIRCWIESLFAAIDVANARAKKDGYRTLPITQEEMTAEAQRLWEEAHAAARASTGSRPAAPNPTSASGPPATAPGTRESMGVPPNPPPSAGTSGPRPAYLPPAPPTTPRRPYDPAVGTPGLRVPAISLPPTKAQVQRERAAYPPGPMVDRPSAWTGTRRTRQMPSPEAGDDASGEYRERVTPRSLYRATNVDGVIAALNDMIVAAGFNISVLLRWRTEVSPNDPVAALQRKAVGEILTGKRIPTPSNIRRIVAACGGTDADQATWEEITGPILTRLPAVGRARVFGRVGVGSR